MLELDKTEGDPGWQLSRALMAVGTYFIRFSVLFASVERLLATRYAECYDSRKNTKILGIVLGFCCIVFSLLLPYLQMYVLAPVWIIFIILAIILIGNISLSRILILVNRRLRRLSLLGTLGYRYQVVQNIRSLSQIEPHAVMNSIFSGLAFALSLTAHSIPEATPTYTVLSYFLVFNFYIVISCFLFIGQIIFNQNTGWKKHGYSTARINVSKEERKRQEITKVKTTLGKIVPGGMSADEHFDSLKVAWS